MFAIIPPIASLAESQQLSLDIAKQIIQAQSNLALYGITVLVGVAVALIAGSWIWNLYLRRHELERAIESLKSEITTKVEEDFTKLTERTKDEVGKIKKEIEKTVEERMILFDAEKARLFALVNSEMKIWENVALWWATAIEGYAKAQDEYLLRISVEGLSRALKKCEKLKDEYKEEVKGHLSSIPQILWREKEQIEDKLKKLPKEISKQSETS